MENVQVTRALQLTALVCLVASVGNPLVIGFSFLMARLAEDLARAE